MSFACSDSNGNSSREDEPKIVDRLAWALCAIGTPVLNIQKPSDPTVPDTEVASSASSCEEHISIRIPPLFTFVHSKRPRTSM